MRHLTLPSLLLASLLLGAGISGSAGAHENDWGGRPLYPRATVRNYSYVYYPDRQVYFSPESGNWFWASGSGWQIGARLPYIMGADMGFGGVPVMLRSPRPYLEHVYVEQRYGAPWRAAHGWGHEHHERQKWRERREWREERNEHRGHGHGHGHGHGER